MLAYVVAVWLLVVGIVGIVTSRHLVHLVLCVTVTQSSTYVLLLAVGFRENGTGRAPIVADLSPGTPVVDPIVQALTLTDVVVEATVTALLLALTVQVAKRFGTVDPDELGALRG